MSAQCHPLPPDCHLRAQEPAVAHNELVSAQAHGARRCRHLSGKNPYSLRQRCRVASVFCKKKTVSVCTFVRYMQYLYVVIRYY